MSATVRPITTKFGKVTRIVPVNFAMPLTAHTLHLLVLCLRTAEVLNTKLALVFSLLGDRL